MRSETLANQLREKMRELVSEETPAPSLPPNWATTDLLAQELSRRSIQCRLCEEDAAVQLSPGEPPVIARSPQEAHRVHLCYGCLGGFLANWADPATSEWILNRL